MLREPDCWRDLFRQEQTKATASWFPLPRNTADEWSTGEARVTAGQDESSVKGLHGGETDCDRSRRKRDAAQATQGEHPSAPYVYSPPPRTLLTSQLDRKG